MEEARQYSVVMHVRRHKLFFTAAICTMLCSTTALAVSPDIQVNEAIWGTEPLELEEFDQSGNMVAVTLLPPDETAFESANEVLVAFWSACRQINEMPDEFRSSDRSGDPFSHVQMVMKLRGQPIYPYAINFRVIDGQCSDKVSFAMPTLAEPFSQHDPNEEMFAVLNSWGMGFPSVSFETGTSGKRMSVEFPLLRAFKREVSELHGGLLCVHAIANLEESIRTLPIPTQPKNYSEIEIQIVDQLGPDPANVRKIIGAVTLSIKDGKCAEKQGGQ